MLNSDPRGSWETRQVGRAYRPRTSRSPVVFVGILAVCVGLLTVCVLGCVGVGLLAVSDAFNDDEEMAADVVDSYLYAMREKDAHYAFQFLSTGGRSKTPLSALEKQVQDTQYQLYADYDSIEVDTFAPVAGSKQKLYRLNGTVLYDHGPSGSCVALLVRQHGEWALESIEIKRTVSRTGGSAALLSGANTAG